MVAISREKIEPIPTVKDCICPKCFRLLPSPAVLPSKLDRYGNETREYFGFCFECNIGYQVVQFKQTDMNGNVRWALHKYKCYAVVGAQYVTKPMGKWVTFFELPEPKAPVVVGPGGEYDKQITPNISELLVQLENALNSTLKVLRELLKNA